ncbi:hypothetical protein TSACC_2921 [Terrimicrobium sacchariphilum]|uniref:Uncharacterized protein n=1 Tax=Terrimicrobium sacchariphilum TaxID=690879 RepID=A0A146G539_TERSA|nr:hypothetical protein [Terrimicrobium sacchariphilum]GAT32522.1 hypothetical protein TSACC_2921 [Terrimicrobium sacchariphilum]
MAEFIPGYEGSFFDKSTNAEIALLQWQRGIMQNFYHVDPEFAQSYAGELSSTLGATVPQMLSMTLPPVAATMIGGQSFLYAWEDAENTAKRLGQSFNRNRAFAYALTMGAVNAAMTMVKFDLTVKPWLNAEGRSLVNNAFKLLRTTLLGTVTNVGQGTINDAIASGFGIEFRNPLDLERRKHDALLGAGTSLVLSLGGMTLAPAAEKTAQPPPEKPGVIFDKSLGKQEVPQSPLPPKTDVENLRLTPQRLADNLNERSVALNNEGARYVLPKDRTAVNEFVRTTLADFRANGGIIRNIKTPQTFFGRYHSKNNIIELAPGRGLDTLVEELIHYRQAQEDNLVGRLSFPGMPNRYEADAVDRLIELGFIPVN